MMHRSFVSQCFSLLLLLSFMPCVHSGMDETTTIVGFIKNQFNRGVSGAKISFEIDNFEVFSTFSKDRGWYEAQIPRDLIGKDLSVTITASGHRIYFESFIIQEEYFFDPSRKLFDFPLKATESSYERYYYEKPSSTIFGRVFLEHFSLPAPVGGVQVVLRDKNSNEIVDIDYSSSSGVFSLSYPPHLKAGYLSVSDPKFEYTEVELKAKDFDDGFKFLKIEPYGITGEWVGNLGYTRLLGKDLAVFEVNFLKLISILDQDPKQGNDDWSVSLYLGSKVSDNVYGGMVGRGFPVFHRRHTLNFQAGYIYNREKVDEQSVDGQNVLTFTEDRGALFQLSYKYLIKGENSQVYQPGLKLGISCFLDDNQVKIFGPLVSFSF